MESTHHTIHFRPSGRGKARCEPNPAYPNGKDIDFSNDSPSCLVDLPYPAPECGIWVVQCHLCEMGPVGITAAGRTDDPKSIRMPCLNIRYTSGEQEP